MKRLEVLNLFECNLVRGGGNCDNVCARTESCYCRHNEASRYNNALFVIGSVMISVGGLLFFGTLMAGVYRLCLSSRADYRKI